VELEPKPTVEKDQYLCHRADALVSNAVINVYSRSNYYYYYTHLIASFPGHVGKPASKR